MGGGHFNFEGGHKSLWAWGDAICDRVQLRAMAFVCALFFLISLSLSNMFSMFEHAVQTPPPPQHYYNMKRVFNPIKAQDEIQWVSLVNRELADIIKARAASGETAVTVIALAAAYFDRLDTLLQVKCWLICSNRSQLYALCRQCAHAPPINYQLTVKINKFVKKTEGAMPPFAHNLCIFLSWFRQDNIFTWEINNIDRGLCLRLKLP